MTANLDPLAIVADDEPQQNYSGVNFGTLQQQRLAGQDPFSVSEGLASQIRQDRGQIKETQGFEFGIGEDIERTDLQDTNFTTTALGNVKRSGALTGLEELQDAGTANMLRAQGLEPVYEQTMYKGYRYNPESGQYDFYDNTPSMLETAVPLLIKAGVMGAATGGLGGALSSGTGISTGLGKALASAGLRGMFGEDMNLENIAKDYISAEAFKGIDEIIGGIDTGYDSVNAIVKKAGGDIIRGKDPKQAILGAVLKNAELPESVAEFGRNFDEKYLQPLKDTLEGVFKGAGDSELIAEIDQVIRDLPTTKEDWQALEDTYHEYVEDPLEELAGTVSDLLPDVDLSKLTGLLAGGGVVPSSGGVATGTRAPTKADLVTVNLENPELVRGFDLSNPFLR